MSGDAMVATHETQRIVDPLFHSGNGGSIPTSPLQLYIETMSRKHFDFGDAIPLLSKAELAECLVHAKTDL